MEAASDTTSPTYMLVNPPLTDPTNPYHSISYLVAAAEEEGFHKHVCIDVNLDILNYLSAPTQVAKLKSRSVEIAQSLNTLCSLTNLDALQMRLYEISFAFSENDVRDAIEVLRCSRDFYNVNKYLDAVETIYNWMDVLTIDGLPFSFNKFFVDSTPYSNFDSLDDITDEEFLERINQPFSEYYNSVLLPTIAHAQVDIVGISVNYRRQLPFTIWLCRLIRLKFPNTLICVGGTEATDTYKGLKTKDLIWNIFDVDLLVVGEGESAFCSILKALQFKSFQPISGVLMRNAPASLELGVKFENVSELPTPNYNIWNWAEYWSPEPVVLYSPTRGCYWNKCTFCDYGLNVDRPTSPSRERRIDAVVDDLHQLATIGKVVYLAVDAISPSFLRRLCRTIEEYAFDIKWAAECRVEKSLSKEDEVGLLSRGGCIAMSFGLESASQRVLNAMEKGMDIVVVPELLTRFREADIGVQLMTFCGFPTETYSEALQTLMFLEQYRQYWSLSNFGKFSLTPGAIVARKAGQFGITVQESEEDIVRELFWAHETNVEGVDPHSIDLDFSSFDWVTDRGLSLRPFLGGIDTAHTLLYFKKNGFALADEVLVKRRNEEGGRFKENSEKSVYPGIGALAIHLKAIGDQSASSNWLLAKRWLESPWQYGTLE